MKTIGLLWIIYVLMREIENYYFAIQWVGEDYERREMNLKFPSKFFNFPQWPQQHLLNNNFPLPKINTFSRNSNYLIGCAFNHCQKKKRRWKIPLSVFRFIYKGMKKEKKLSFPLIFFMLTLSIFDDILSTSQRNSEKKKKFSCNNRHI